MSFDQNTTRFGMATGRVATHPELELITRYPSWCQFGTLTFIGKAPPSHGCRRKMAFAWLRTMATMADQDFSRLIWCLRDEQGEITGRHHFHVLLGRTHLPLSPATNFRLMAAWERLGGGMARVKTFNRSLAGAEYVSKCLSGESTRGESAYELDKFGWTESPPELSHSLREYLARRTLCERRPGGTLQGPDTGKGSRVRPVTGDPSPAQVLKPPARAGTDKPRECLIEQSSLLWKLGRHPWGLGRSGHRG